MTRHHATRIEVEDLTRLPALRRDDIRAGILAIAVLAMIVFLCSLDGIRL